MGVPVLYFSLLRWALPLPRHAVPGFASPLLCLADHGPAIPSCAFAVLRCASRHLAIATHSSSMLCLCCASLCQATPLLCFAVPSHTMPCNAFAAQRPSMRCRCRSMPFNALPLLRVAVPGRAVAKLSVTLLFHCGAYQFYAIPSRNGAVRLLAPPSHFATKSLRIR